MNFSGFQAELRKTAHLRGMRIYEPKVVPVNGIEELWELGNLESRSVPTFGGASLVVYVDAISSNSHGFNVHLYVYQVHPSRHAETLGTLFQDANAACPNRNRP